MADELIGTRLLGPDDEWYEIVEFLGSGSFGKVYRAIGEASAVLAVKVTKVDDYASPSYALRSISNECGVRVPGR